MSDIPAFPYEILWGERIVRSVANLTRRDAEEFLALAPRAGVQTQSPPIRSSGRTTPCATCAPALHRRGGAGPVRTSCSNDVANVVFIEYLRTSAFRPSTAVAGGERPFSPVNQLGC